MRFLWLGAVLVLFLTLSSYQLGLPGLHYDEAREAGLNAMELLTGAPVTAFRGAGFTLAGRTLPWMVQDYIGALNVYLALPLLALTGIGVPNVRALAILTGLVALLLLERAVTEWLRYQRSFDQPGATPPIDADLLVFGRRPWRVAQPSYAGLITVTLLAASPSYVFWARQGVFVTNLMLPFVFLCLWQGVRWLRTGKASALALTGLAAGLALYAKLLAVWVVGPFGLLLGGWWLWLRWRKGNPSPRLTPGALLLAGGLFLLPLLPLLLFNLTTGGTFASFGGNLHESYYGVNNADVVGNLPVRWAQLVQSLRGEQFWYLGGIFANPLAPWLAGGVLLAGLWRNWRRVLGPLLLTLAAFLCSLFTVSDLFITHFVLLQPLVVACVALALSVWLDAPPRGEEVTDFLIMRQPRGGRNWRRSVPILLVGGVVVTWLAGDIRASLQYHRALAQSGGLADHSDASYQLAYYLQTNGLGAPIALDWGMDASVRYLTAGAVTPIEIFGYASPAGPDDGFLARLTPFLANPDNTYLLHAPGATVFQGRREAFLAEVAALDQEAQLEAQFTQRDGTPLYELWRVAPQQ